MFKKNMLRLFVVFLTNVSTYCDEIFTVYFHEIYFIEISRVAAYVRYITKFSLMK